MLRTVTIEVLVRYTRATGYRASRLAQILKVTSRSLDRWFREELNCSPGEWLAQQRMCDAMAMLRDGWSIKDMADALGYRHSPQFCREFRTRVGCTPREFAAQEKKTISLRVQIRPTFPPLEVRTTQGDRSAGARSIARGH